MRQAREVIYPLSFRGEYICTETPPKILDQNEQIGSNGSFSPRVEELLVVCVMLDRSVDPSHP